jgi:opacity protein-like surface antigen
MRAIFSKGKFVCSIFLGIIVLGSTFIYAESGKNSNSPDQRRVSFSIFGGYAHSESRGGMVDLKTEVQLDLSANIRVGLGVGYLSDFHGMHMDGSFGSMHGGMMGGSNAGFMGGFSEHTHNFRIIPLTLSLYYVLPINSKLDVFMQGGGGYYIGNYKDQSDQSQDAFGPHLGMGFDFKVADRITIIAEGNYRFVNLKGFSSELHQGFREGMGGEEHEEGLWHFHHHEEEWHFHEEHEDAQQMLTDVPPFDLSLNGISLRVGIKFLF